MGRSYESNRLSREKRKVARIAADFNRLLYGVSINVNKLMEMCCFRYVVSTTFVSVGCLRWEKVRSTDHIFYKSCRFYVPFSLFYAFGLQIWPVVRTFSNIVFPNLMTLGYRLVDLLKLKYENFEDDTISVIAQKTGKARTVKIYPRIKGIVEKCRKQLRRQAHHHLFVRSRFFSDKPISRMAAITRIKEGFNFAGIERTMLSGHTLECFFFS